MRKSFVPNVANKILADIDEWKSRPLCEIYPIIFIDAVHFSVRVDSVVKKLATYVVLGINEDGIQEVLSLEIGQNESSNFWLSVLNGLKTRGIRDIMVICADGLSGMKETIAAAFPDTEYQRCIIHQVRNTLKHVSYKDMKSFAAALKTIYHAPNEKIGHERMEAVTKKWEPSYPNAMKSWGKNWNLLCSIFKFSSEV